MLKLLVRLHLQFLPHSHHLLTQTQELSLAIVLKRKNRGGGDKENKEGGVQREKERDDLKMCASM